jgi:hypothetical protein
MPLAGAAKIGHREFDAVRVPRVAGSAVGLLANSISLQNSNSAGHREY